MNVLITGSGGLVGSEAVIQFSSISAKVIGIDNDMRSEFFGSGASVKKTIDELKDKFSNYEHIDHDLRDDHFIEELFKKHKPEVIIHCAAQPSHDWAANDPLTDFDINARSTLILLEAFRKYSPNGSFIFMSTNKVYGDGPNQLSLTEGDQRFDFSDSHFTHGIAENFSIDQSLHSLFGVSKAAADLLVQEYGRYYHLNTVCFRGGCITGPRHAGAPLHGFLSHLIKSAVKKEKYKIIGFQGKQVRDQLHAYDLVMAFKAFLKKPKSAAVYNMGGGKNNSASVLECIALIEKRLSLKMDLSYEQKARMGDHICYYSDLSKFHKDYPEWRVSRDLNSIIEEMIQAEQV